MEKLFHAHQVFLCIATEERIEQEQTILIMQHLEDEHPDVLIKEEGVLGCIAIEDVIASEIPFMIFDKDDKKSSPLKKIINNLKNHELSKTFKKIILICNKETFDDHISSEFQNFVFDDVMPTKPGGVYLAKKESGVIRHQEISLGLSY